MMKSIQVIFFCLLMSTHIFAQQTEERNLKPFDALFVKGSMEVTLEQSDVERVEIDARDIPVSDVITKVVKGTLEVRLRKRNYQDVDVRMKIYFKNLQEITQNGSGEMVMPTPLKSENLKIRLTGSGDFDGKVDVSDLTLELTGSGDIELAGTAKTQKTVLHGSGDVEAHQLKSEDVKVEIYGSGDVEVWATQRINAQIWGSGDILYTGEPKEVVSKVTGSGEVEGY